MKILVAIDSSPHAREAIRFVKSVVWPKNTEIYLMHVIELKHAAPFSPLDGPSSWDRVISQARGKLLAEARHFLDQTKQDMHEQHSLTIKSVVEEGLPGEEILTAAQNYQVDLVILGTRGLSKIKRFLLGSTSEWVMRDAPCSVLLVREKLSRVTMGKTASHILLATDGSSGACDTVGMLSLLTCKTPPKVTVAHVVARPAYLEGWYWGKGKAEFKQLAEELMAKAQEDGAQHLEEISRRVKDLNMKVDSILRKGDPAEEILKLAEKTKAKLIMVGSKGIKDGKPIPLGGIVKKIARHAHCSVLLTRPGKFEKGG
ncbi:MAG: universal stress protein [Nitrospirales bacterium]